jgi:hypothetical protein
VRAAPAIRIVAILAAAVWLSPELVAAEGTLYGKVVVYPEGSPRKVRLRLGDHGFADIKDDGQFAIVPAPGEKSIDITLVQPPDFALISPPDGRLALGAGPHDKIWVVVGADVRRYLLEKLAARQVALRAWTLDKTIGAQAAEIHADTKAILAKLNLSEAELQREMSRCEQRTDMVREIFTKTDAYLLKLRDFQAALASMAPLAAKDPQAVQTIARAVRQYNDAFTPFNNGRHAFESGILSSWKEAKAEGLTRDLADLYRAAIDELHKPYVLSLNADILTLARIGHAAPPTRAEVEAAVVRITAYAREMPPRIDSVQTCFDHLREHMQSPCGAAG